MKVILWFSMMVAAGLYICGPIIDPDLWWHLTAGRWMIANQAIPHVDYWSMFGQGQPWRAYSWLVEVVFAAVDNGFGPRGLLVIKMLLAVLISCSFAYCLGRISRDWFVGAVLGVWTTLGCFNHFTLRPQSLIWVYFIWLILVAERIQSEGLTKRRVAALAGIMVLWANTHLSSVLALLAVCGWLWRPSDTKITLKAAGALFVGTLFTPYLGGEWITLISKSAHPFQHQDIAEFQSATVMQYSTAFVIIQLVVLLTFLHLRPRCVEGGKLIAGSLFLIAGLAIVKFLPLSVIYNSALIAIIWHRERLDRRVLGNLAEAIERFRTFFHKIPREGLSFVLICLGITYAVRPWREPINTDIVPVAAVDFMIERKLPTPILNEFGRGGYLMYRYSDRAGNPGILVPIDGRTNVTPPKIFKQFDAALSGRKNWREYFESVKPRTVLWPTESPLTSILLAGQEWCLVYWTGDEEQGYSVFVERAFWEANRSEFASENCEPKDPVSYNSTPAGTGA